MPRIKKTTCCKEGCNNPRHVTSTGNTISYCKTCDTKRQRERPDRKTYQVKYRGKRQALRQRRLALIEARLQEAIARYEQRHRSNLGE